MDAQWLEGGVRDLRVVVIGGTRGIGMHVASAFALAGARVSVCGRTGGDANEDSRSSVAPFIHCDGCDVRDGVKLVEYFERAAGVLGGIDALLVCASSLSSGDEDDAWRDAIEVDLLGTVRAVRHATPWLIRSQRASITTVGSTSVLRLGGGAYATAKAAVMYYTRAKARELASHGVRVNGIVPGPTMFKGSVWEQIAASNPSLYERTEKQMTLGGFVTPDDISGAALFLASGAAQRITGQLIVIDSGQTLAS